MAYPAPSKGADECVKAFRHFLGKRPAVELHADNTPEFEGTASQLGLVYDATVPYRKTAIINRAIRTLEGITRCCLAQVGNFNELWPIAIKFAATALSTQKWGRLHNHDLRASHSFRCTYPVQASRCQNQTWCQNISGFVSCMEG